PRDRLSRAPALAQCATTRHRHDRVHGGFHGVDPREDCLHDLERRDLARPIELQQLDRGGEAEIAFSRHGGDRPGSPSVQPGSKYAAIRLAGSVSPSCDMAAIIPRHWRLSCRTPTRRSEVESKI